MRFTTKTVALCLLASAALLSGCTSMTGGAGSTASSSSAGQDQSTGANQDLHGAPKVQHPLDTAKFLSAPCNLLTPAQLQKLGISGPGSSNGDTCDFHDTTSQKRLSITVGGEKSGGLGTFYQKKPSLAVLEPLPDIEGFPAVHFEQADTSDIGGCDVAVGTSDDVAYTIDTFVQDKSAPCTATNQVAHMVVQTLKGGS